MKTKWTCFNDMHSGGGTKEKGYEYIYIEAPEEEAKVIFYNKFGHSPNRVSCTCCGDDYSTSESDSLEQATAFERGCRYAYFNSKGEEINRDEGFIVGKGIADGCVGKYVEEGGGTFNWNNYTPLASFVKKKEVLIIARDKITKSERNGEVPEQGYVWQD